MNPVETAWLAQTRDTFNPMHLFKIYFCKVGTYPSIICQIDTYSSVSFAPYDFVKSVQLGHPCSGTLLNFWIWKLSLTGFI